MRWTTTFGSRIRWLFLSASAPYATDLKVPLSASAQHRGGSAEVAKGSEAFSAMARARSSTVQDGVVRLACVTRAARIGAASRPCLPGPRPWRRSGPFPGSGSLPSLRVAGGGRVGLAAQPPAGVAANTLARGSAFWSSRSGPAGVDRYMLDPTSAPLKGSLGPNGADGGGRHWAGWGSVGIGERQPSGARRNGLGRVFAPDGAAPMPKRRSPT